MCDDTTVLYLLDNPVDMDCLSATFSTHFLQPLLFQKANPSPLVIAFYGVSDAGKTHFLDGFTEPFRTVSNYLTSGSYKGERSCRLYDMAFRYVDMGTDTYPYLFWEPSRAAFGGKMCNENMLEDLIFVRGKKGQGGFDAIEHASVPHLLRSDVVVSFGVPKELQRETCYYHNLVTFVSEELSKSIDKEGEVGPYCSWDFSRIEDVLQKALPGMEKMFKASRACSSHERDNRVVSLTLLSNRPETKAAFGKFNNQASRHLGMG